MRPVLLVAGLALTALVVDAIAALLVDPALPRIAFPGAATRPMELAALEPEPDATAGPATSPAMAATGTPLQRLAAKSYLRSAFLVQDDPAGAADLRQNLQRLEVVFPDWYACTKPTGELQENIQVPLAKMVLGSSALLMPRLCNADGGGKWRSDELAKMLPDYAAGQRLIDELIHSLQENGAHGVNIDFEALDAKDSEPLLNWLERLGTALHAKGLCLSVDVPLYDEAYDYEMIGKLADLVVVMAYDEHFPGGAAGPLASADWFRDAIDELTQRIGKQKLIVALGGYGYDWNTRSRRPAESLTFTEAMERAARHKAWVQTDAKAVNSHFTYQDDGGNDHEVWLLDAVSAWNQSALVRQSQCRGISLWRLGMEEPAALEAIVADPLAPQMPNLARVAAMSDVMLVGNGELLQVRQTAQEGVRDLTFDGPLVDWAGYRQLPRGFVIDRFGGGTRQVALTFDDGPDPRWTPQVLDVLAKHGVTGSFFLVGDCAQRCPQIVRRTIAENHLLGNHTFLHPDLQTCGEQRIRVELTATERAIEGITGRQMLLFRPPYDTDSSPTRARQLAPLSVAADLGYVIAAGDVDSCDYDRPGAERIVQNVLDRLAQTHGGAVVFHDGGGDRSQTVEALDRLIPLLRQQGYQIVSLDQMGGVSPQALMPAESEAERLIVGGMSFVTWMRSSGWSALVVVFAVTTVISAARIIFLGAVVVWRRKRRPGAEFTPPLTVLVPAYNESRVIARTIECALRSDYPNFTLLVIDDGSTDDTAEVVQRIADHEPRVRLITMRNQGKASALNVAMQQVSDDIVVTIDADTLITPLTLRRLAEPFVDPSVDAVCGNVQVGNVHNALTAFQDVEYVTSQNYDRRAFDGMNCISVVPGATGAWRRQRVLDVGGYSTDTLTEDADLTLCLLRDGARIVYAPEARSITEAPETVKTLFRQRFRWSFGTLQCLWKHRSALGRGTLGCIALPNMLLFQVLFPLLAPIGDAVLLLSLIRGDLGAIAVGYLMFLAMDLVGSAAGFWLDGRNVGRLWVVFVQRFFYRQFMYVVTLRTVWASLRGRRHGWNKLKREGSITVAAELVAA